MRSALFSATLTAAVRTTVVVSAAVLTAMAGCDEPMDCGTGPGKCLQTPPARTYAMPNTPVIPLPTELVRNLPRQDRVAPPNRGAKPRKQPLVRRAKPVNEVQRGIARNIGAPAVDNNVAPQTAEKEPRAQLVYRSRKTPADLVRRITNVAANHNTAGLKRFCTPKLQAHIDEMIRDHKDRFWRHVDKYVTAASEGFIVEEVAGPEPKQSRVTVKTRAGLVLNPIMSKGTKGWLFDRF
jgi:hypothetical protein